MSLLKQGARHYQGEEEAVIRNITACKEMAAITRTSLGPQGMNKMVIDSHEKLIVTNDAVTMLKELEIQHPAAMMLVMAAGRQEQEVGDGTNLVITLSGELLKQAETLLRLGLHPSDVVQGYRKATTEVLKWLEELAEGTKCTDIRDRAQVARYIHSAVASKQLSYATVLSALLADACVSVCPKEAALFNVDHVRTVKVPGGGVTDSQVIHGLALVTPVRGHVRQATNAKVAVLPLGVDLAKTEAKGVVTMDKAEQLLSFSKDEEQLLENRIKQLADMGVKVVVSGEAVSEMALHFLDKYELMVLKLHSKFDMRRVCTATGAQPVVTHNLPAPSDLGHVDSVGMEEIGSTNVCVFRQENADNDRIVTVLVRAATSNLLEDIDRCIDDAVNVYKGMTRDARFVPGAGATETELSVRLRTLAESTPGLEQYAINKFAEALEVVPRTLAENAGLNATTVVTQMIAAHSKGDTHASIHLESGEVKSASEMGVFDLYGTKYWAVKLAADAAITVLGIDQIIMSKPAGGPKIRQPGARDA